MLDNQDKINKYLLRVRKFAPTQSDIVLCDSLLTLCDELEIATAKVACLESEINELWSK